MNDEFIELVAATSGSKSTAPVIITVFKMRNGGPKVSFSIAEALIARVGWPRYSIAFNLMKRQFRIRASDDGRFEGYRPAKSLHRVVIRAPLPDGVKPTIGFRDAPIHVLQGKDLFVSLPSSLWPDPKPVTRGIDASPVLMGDPAPGRSALAQRTDRK